MKAIIDTANDLTLTEPILVDDDPVINEMVNLFVTGRWVTGHTYKQLCDRDGGNRSTYRNKAAMASKLALAYATGGDSEDVARLVCEVRAATMGRAQAISIKAERDKKYGEATNAARLVAELAGAMPSKGVIGAPQVNVQVNTIVDAERSQLRDAVCAVLTERYGESDALAVWGEAMARLSAGSGGM